MILIWGRLFCQCLQNPPRSKKEFRCFTDTYGRFREPTKQNKTKHGGFWGHSGKDSGGIRAVFCFVLFWGKTFRSIFGRPAMAIWGVLHMEQKGVADHFGGFLT